MPNRTRRHFALLILGLLAASVAGQGFDRERETGRIAETFLLQEKEIWELENLLLKEAMDAVMARELQRSATEFAHRQAIRKARSKGALRRVRDFIQDYLTAPSREMLLDIAEVNGVRPEEVFADFLTVEATLDFALMASAYTTVRGSNFDKFPPDSKQLLRDLTESLRQAPTPSDQIEVGRIRGQRLTVRVFGCDIHEEVIEVDDQRKSALLTWKSNYSFLRDLKDRKLPQATRRETLVLERERWTISYENELREFVDLAGKEQWGKRVRELVDIDGYLGRRDPLDEAKARRARYRYDPEPDDESVRFTGERRRDPQADRQERDRSPERNRFRE